MQLGGLPVETDVWPGVWISVARRFGEAGTVAALLPAFESYARVFHPAVRYDGDDDIEVSWSEVAAHNGTRAHPLMQWHTITGSWDAEPSERQAAVWDDGPAEGHLPVEVAARLAAVLGRHTTTPEECLFGRCDGFGYDLPDPETPPRLLLRENHDVVLVRGAVTDAVRNLAPEPHEQSANLWWPGDRAWCVATEIDLTSTYVGGSAACIAELLRTPGIEALPARPEDPTAFAADTLNPLPGGR
ncbi:hypothetical protein SAMN05660485_00706 [Blastococcus fimeti]|nr:hypothetical protein SAMN05660485_00706 [Blastococcus fimeti]